MNGSSRWISLILTLLLVLPAVAAAASPAGSAALAATAQQESNATFAEAACPFALPRDIEEGEELTCGYLTVPERHAELNGPTAELAVAIFKSTASLPAEEPLVLLLGGPGQEVESILIAFSESSPVSYLPLLERQDVILLEQRGIGYSTPSLACSFDAVGGERPEVGANEIEDAVPALAQCAADLKADGIDLEAFDTLENAADVNDLRVALGYEQVDLFGISYGSKLGLTVMRDFPEAVRSAVLASPVPLQANVVAGQIIGFDRALKRLFAACAADVGCDRLFPDLDQQFSDAFERFNEEPLEMEVVDPVTGEHLDLVVDGPTFAGIIYISVFIGLLLPFVPGMIDGAAHGEYEVLEIVAPFSVAYAAGISIGANFVYSCNDEYSFTDPEEVAELVAEADVMPELADGEFSGAIGGFEICTLFDLEPAERLENRPARSPVPALIVAGEYDPITPPAYADEAARYLPNSYVVVLPGVGHDPVTTGGACAMQIVQSFLDAPEVAPDTSCTEDMGLEFIA